MSAPQGPDEYIVFRPTRRYLALLAGSTAAVVVIGVACVYQGLTGRGLALLVVGGLLVLVSVILAANAFVQRGRALYLGSEGFRDATALGDTGVVSWDRVEEVEVRSRSLVRLYMVLPAGFVPGPQPAARVGRLARGGNGRGRDDDRNTWIVISCAGYPVSSAEIGRLINQRLAAARSARRAGRPSRQAARRR